MTHDIWFRDGLSIRTNLDNDQLNSLNNAINEGHTFLLINPLGKRTILNTKQIVGVVAL